jgi:hypothetical protein
MTMFAVSRNPTPCNAQSRMSDVVVGPAHADHFVFPCPVSSPSSCLSRAIICSRLLGGGLATEADGLQLAPLTGPDAQRRHQGGAAHLECPPEKIRGYRMRVQGGDDEVDKVYGKGEVEHELRARD